MVYLKTLFYSPAEIKYIRMNIRESSGYVDKYIVCEFNYNHVGEAKDYVFEKYAASFTPDELAKIIYIKGDIAAQIKPAVGDSRLAHENERLIRGYFARQLELADDDIVFSVDADEILFRRVYPDVIARLRARRWFWQPKSYLFALRQFFYKINYFWENNEFIAPIACLASAYKHRYPGQWRYEGRRYPGFSGCHFSWCLSVPDMITKLRAYAHQSDFAHLADAGILEKAIKNKEYPFDPIVDFRIRVLDLDKDKEYFPGALYGEREDFRDLIASE